MRRIILYLALVASLSACAEPSGPSLMGPEGSWQLVRFDFELTVGGVTESVTLADTDPECSNLTFTLKDDNLFTGQGCLAFLRWPHLNEGPDGLPVGFFYGNIDGPEFLVGTWKVIETDPPQVNLSFDFGDLNRDTFLERFSWSFGQDSLYRVWSDAAETGHLVFRRVP